MACYRRKKHYFTDNGIYAQKCVTFTRAERISMRSINSKCFPTHLYTCYTANNAFLKVGGTATIPLCQGCTEFSSESKLKKSLLGKTQFSQNIAKRFECKWMLRGSLPNGSKRQNEESLQTKRPLSPENRAPPNSSQVSIAQKNNKRVKLTHADIKTQISTTHEKYIEDMKEEIVNKFNLERASLQKIIDEKEKKWSSRFFILVMSTEE